MSYRNSFFQGTIYETFVNESDESIPAFACVPFTYDTKNGRTARKATKLDESEQDYARIGFNGPGVVKPGSKGELTQQWPAIASVPMDFGPVDIGAKLGPTFDKWTLGWGTAFTACGMVDGNTGKQLLMVHPARNGYSGPGFQVAGGPVTVLSGEHLTIDGTNAYRIAAFGAEAMQDDFTSNFASRLELQAALADGGSELLVPRRGKYRVAFNGMAYSETGLETVTDMTFRWRLRTTAGAYHLTPLIAYGVTRLDPTEYDYEAGRQTRSQMGITGEIPLRHNWALSLQNTSDVSVILENFLVSILHIGPIDAVNLCPWGNSLWE